MRLSGKAGSKRRVCCCFENLISIYCIKIFRLLLNGCPLIAVHKARYFKREDGLALGPGPFATALEYAANTSSITVGKPQPSFFHEALNDMKILPENAVMIGDVSSCLDCG